jgi:uncharacterized membrane protein YcaP (DUF421 family)
MPNEASNVQVFDLHRMLIGDLPWLFTCEVIVRTVVMYVYVLALIRLLSKRAIGQLSLVEFLLVVALGSAVGDPMFYPDVPLLHGMAVITVIVMLNRGLDFGIAHSEVVERLLEGHPQQLVHTGRILYKGLDAARMGREELFQYLRLQGIEHLGQVRAAYFEQGGHLSVFCHPPHAVQPGLRIVPPWDLDAPTRFTQGQQVEHSLLLACEMCGSVRRFPTLLPLPPCHVCDASTWVDAVLVPTTNHIDNSPRV